MSDLKKCAQCGAELAPGAPEGLCPACLLIRGLETQTEGGAAAGFTPPTPEELARYFPQLEILELLGRGGMGVVYKARQKQLDRLVALKILAAPAKGDPAFAERFSREALALARLSHPNIVAVFDSGQTDGLFYFLMEYVDGLNLRQLLNTAKIAPREALAIVPQICDALQYAHDRGIVHRDIKPENILMDKSGRVKIADFGLAKIIGREARDLTLTGAGEVMGTPAYMAPEQVEHPQQVDHRADIYSVGVVFYQMLTGELPMGRFAAPSKKVQIDVRLDEVVLRALEKEPDLRWQQASVLKTQVETIVHTPPPAGAAGAPGAEAATDSGAEERAQRARHAVKIPAIGLMVLSGIGLLGSVVIGFCLLLKLILASRNVDSAGLFVIVELGVVLASVLNGFILVAARRMIRLRGHNSAVFVAILAIVLSLGCFFLPVIIPGGLLAMAFGIWALVVLNQHDVKDAFDECAKNPPEISSWTSEPHFSRTAIVGACWIPFILIALLLVWRVSNQPAALPVAQTAVAAPNIATARPMVSYAHSSSGMDWLAVLIIAPLALAGITAPFGATILGCVAISQIRRSRGKLHGLGLAWFDALFFPLLALDGLVLGFCFVVVKLLAVWVNSTFLYSNLADGFWILVWLLLTAAISAWVDFLIIRRVWRTVNKPSHGSVSTPPSGQPQTPGRNTPRLVLSLILVALVLFLVPVLLWIAYRSAEVHSPQSGVPEIESVVVSTDRAVIKQRSFHGEGMAFALGTPANRWEPKNLDSLFVVNLEWPWSGHGANWVVRSHGPMGYHLDSPTGTITGQIVFHQGTPAPEADGSYVIAEFRPDGGQPIPITVKLTTKPGTNDHPLPVNAATAYKGDIGNYIDRIGNVIQPSGTFQAGDRPHEFPVIFSIPENNVQEIMKKMDAKQPLPVKIYKPDSNGAEQIGEGSVVGMDNEIDITTGTLRLRAVIVPQGDFIYLPGMFVDVRVLLETHKGVTLLPTAAIQQNGNTSFVYVIEDHVAKVRNIKTGAVDDKLGITQVEGINPGDIVVVGSPGNLHEGASVDYKLAQNTAAPSTPAAAQELSFGPEVKGMQAAVELTPAGGNVALGELIKVRFHIRNTSNPPISIEGKVYRQGDDCIVKDEQGHDVEVPLQSEELIRTPTQRFLLEAGEAAIFDSGGLVFVSGNMNNATHLASYLVPNVKPGRYTVRFRLRFPPVPHNAESAELPLWNGDLETAPVTVDVSEPGPASQGAPSPSPSPAESREVLTAELQQAKAGADRFEAQFKAGIGPENDFVKAKDRVEILQAKLAGDPVLVAKVTLAAAQRQADFASMQYKAGLMTAEEYEKAKGDVAIAQAKLREAETATAE